MPKFYKGDVVSCGAMAGVVIELKRRSDGAPFLMVEITNSQRKGDREYPDQGWQLGIGTLDASCERCGRRFLFKPGDIDHTCQRCWAQDEAGSRARTADPDIRSTSWDRRQRELRARERTT
jgi:hypothetical protein